MRDDIPSGKRPIPARRIRASAIAAGILGSTVTIPLVVKGWVDGNPDPSWYTFALAAGLGLSLSLWPLILFAVSLMHARIDSHKRGGDTPV